MLSLLHEYPRHEYPGDYLSARINYRRGRMTAADHDPYADKNSSAGISDAEIWDWDQEERQWLFRQMNFPLRRAAAPVFIYFEIKQLISALRCIEAGAFASIESLVEKSLLAAGLQKILLAKMGIAETVARLESLLHESPLVVRGLTEVFEQKGVQGCEEMIRTNFLSQALREDLHREVRSFFRYFIEMQNALTMAKCRRWNMESTPPVPRGDDSRITSLPVSEERLQRMVHRLTGSMATPANDLHPVSLETVLHTALLQKMARQRRQGSQLCACIEYLMISHAAARNRSASLHKRDRELKESDTMEAMH